LVAEQKFDADVSDRIQPPEDGLELLKACSAEIKAVAISSFSCTSYVPFSCSLKVSGYPNQLLDDIYVPL
jgi:hypothetical protein